jgi:GntR family transcriptional regulator of vanillate catabolism
MSATGTAKTHAMRALIQLRQRIISGEITGGQRLFEVALAEDLNISRTPVREAMSRLVEEGLLDRVRGGGFSVRRFVFADVLDTIELRGVLEGTAARLAAERGVTTERLEAIKTIVMRLDESFDTVGGEVDLAAYSELNSQFHTDLSRLSGSEMLEREVARACQLPFASPSAFLPDRMKIKAFQQSLQIAQAQHHALVEAIENRQGARAEAIAREHARAAQQNLQHIFSADRSTFSSLPGLGLVSS